MKNYFKSNKLILAFCITFSSLNAAHNQPSKDIVTFLKKTDLALTSWRKLKNTWLWSRKSSQTRITHNCAQLAKTQKNLISYLGLLNTKNISINQQDRDTLLFECTQDLNNYAPPCHIRRHWTNYVLSSAALIGGAYVISQHGYDQNGNHLIKNLYTEHIKEPVVNMYNILTNNHNPQTLLVQNTQEALNRFDQDLDTFITEAQDNDTITVIVNRHIPQNVPLNEVDQQDKLAFLDDILTFSAKQSISDIQSWHPFSTARTVKMLGNSGILFAQQLRLEKMLATNTINQMSDKMNLTVEFMAAVPAMVGSYALFKGIRSYSASHIKNYVNTPIKKLLIKLQLQLNKDRYKQTPSFYTQGMSIYWISQLQDYTHRIPTQDREIYTSYLAQISDNALLPEQKITVIDSMFKEFEFLKSA
ncbi:MAG: hypothetical protein ACJAZS_000083 [Alteromonas naphthalenivorans]|jgi:hypothetical protein